MLRNAVGWLFGLVAAGSVYAGCTQDFSTFEPTAGSGGGKTTMGTTMSSNSTGGSGQGGGGQGGCQTITDCPTPSNPCEVPTCQDTKCGTANAMNGVMCSANNGHACFGGICVGCLQDSDCGTQANDCKEFSCQSDHTCMLGNKMDGSTCGAGMALHCMGGTCGGCTNDGMCGTPTQCVAFSCNLMSGNCSTMNLLEGQPTSDQTSNDCMKNICHNGVEEAVVDQTDLPANASPCQTGTCSGQGVPGQTNNNPDSACGGGKVCDASNPPNCVNCTATANGTCTGTQVCVTNNCCTPGTEAALCGAAPAQCGGMIDDTCGGTVTCDLGDCGGGNWECDGTDCCPQPTLSAACGLKCGGMITDACNAQRNCNNNTCIAGDSCVAGTCTPVCVPKGQHAACGNGTQCSGMASDGCGGMVTCTLAVCGGSAGAFECDPGGDCCSTPTLVMACGTQCSGTVTDSCGATRTCADTVCGGATTCQCLATPPATCPPTAKQCM